MAGVEKDMLGGHKNLGSNPSFPTFSLSTAGMLFKLSHVFFLYKME